MLRKAVVAQFAGAVLIVLVLSVVGCGKGDETEKAGGAVAAAGRPAGGGAAPAEAGKRVAEMLKLAPEGTWGTVILDIGKIAGAPVIKAMQESMGQPAPDPKDVRVKVAVYIIPPTDGTPLGDNPPSWCAAAWAEGATVEDIVKGMPEGVAPTTVAGHDAYTAPAGPVPAMIAPVEDGLILAGMTEDSLAAVIERYESGKAAKLDEGVTDMASIFAGDAIVAGFALPDDLRATMEKDAPDTEAAQALVGAEGIAVALAFTDMIELKGMLRLASSGDAATLMAEAQKGIQGAVAAMQDPQQAQKMGPMAMMAQPLVAILGKIKFSTDGADLKVNLKLDQPEVMSLAQMGMGLAPMFMGGMGGPGMGGPPMGAPGMGGPPSMDAE